MLYILKISSSANHPQLILDEKRMKGLYLDNAKPLEGLLYLSCFIPFTYETSKQIRE